jgi:hypothetical protein
VAFRSLIYPGWDIDLTSAGKGTGLAGIFLLALDHRFTRQFLNAFEGKVRGRCPPSS